MNPIPTNSQAQIDALNAASAKDAKLNQGSVPSAFSSERSVLSVRPLPVRQEQMLRGQKSVVALAFAESSPSGGFVKALDSLQTIHAQWKTLNARTEESRQHAVRAEYVRLVDLASEGLTAGNYEAMDSLESEKDISTRFEAELDALEEAIRKLGHASIPHAVIVAKEIDGVLAKLANRLEAQDAAECETFGIELEYSVSTRLVQSVRVQFDHRTHDLKRFQAMHPGAGCTVFAKGMFKDFIDLSSWR